MLEKLKMHILIPAFVPKKNYCVTILTVIHFLRVLTVTFYGSRAKLKLWLKWRIFLVMNYDQLRSEFCEASANVSTVANFFKKTKLIWNSENLKV